MKKSRMRSKRIWVNMAALCVVLLLACAVGIMVHYHNEQKGTDVYDNLKKDAVTELVETTAVQTETEQNPWNPVKKVDFPKLWEQNPEVYAWIELPGTDISYPVLQHAGEDDYYLQHTIEHVESLPGAIYSEKSSKKDFSGFIHILYGHNMRNGTMFGGLKQYMEADFFEEHPYIYIYTPEKTYIYEIFAGVVHSDAHLMYAYDFVTQEGRQEYIDAILTLPDDRNQYREAVAVTPDSQLLILSTCVSGEGDKRYLINAVHVGEEG